MILADGAVSAALLGAGATVLAALVALVGAWGTLRASKRMREEAASVDQRKLDQESFKAFTERYDRERREQEARARRAEQETERTRDALRKLWDHVLELRALMRANDIMPPPAPRLAVYPWDDLGEERPNGHS